jgi:phytoene dehydrogenase-like protein
MDPFAVALFADGRRVRFHRSVERTLASIAEISEAEARSYGDLMTGALPLIEAATAAMEAGPHPRALARALRARGRRLHGLRPRLAAAAAAPYRRVLETHLPSDLTRAPVAAFAAHAGAAPEARGGGLFALWQAAYHRFGQWHAVGGSQALTDALVRRLEHSGGTLRCDAPVTRIEAAGGRVRAVTVAGSERLAADVVVAAIEPRMALLELLDPPLGGRTGARLRRVHRGNAVQAVVHVATSRLPPWTDARPGDWNGLQSLVDRLDGLSQAFRAAEAGRLPRPAGAYAFTPSALDDSLAPAGEHTVYLATPTAPYALAGGWRGREAALADDLLEQVERRAPGFRDSVLDVAVRSPEAMAAELRWPGAHPMHVDVTLDQLGPLRPTFALGRHATPVSGLFLGGAGAAPTGGVSGLPGRQAARAVLRRAGAL